MTGPTLVFLFGPPAVGKMAVGRALENLTGWPLFHNHMTIELVLPFFAFGSEPFVRLVGGFRRQLLAEVAASELPGMIFTYVWAFDEPSDQQFVEATKQTSESQGGRVVFVELWTDLETRLERNASPLRLAEKPSQRDVAAARARLLDIDARYRLTSDGHFPFTEYLWLDNTHVSAARCATRIADHFSLPRLVPDR